ncbi:MAG: hypothetical protein GY940_39375, partial [bacterium]|nr:hypothetical protein [bacterium]
IVNIAAIAASYQFDLPTGYTIVLLHALTAIIASFIFSDRNGAQNPPK